VGGVSGFEQMSSSAVATANSASAAQSTAAYASNPFEDPTVGELDESNEADPELPGWLVEMPDELDVFIAQRNFVDAVKLVNRAQEHFELFPKWCDNQMQIDLKLKID